MSKVVLISNFGLENVADLLVKEGLSQEEAEAEAKMWNSLYCGHDSDPYFATVKPDEYILYRPDWW